MDLENLRYKYFLTEIFVLGQKAAGVRGFNNVQDYYTIQKQCLEAGKLFEDPEFPPTGRWLRPYEICKNLKLDSPKFFIDNATRFDIKQGRIGDCWFLAAMAAVTASRPKFNRIVCKDNSFDENYAGIFHFRFWIHGKWVEVVVDDRLPVNIIGQLNCLQSNEPNEFWSALLEKAYAKLFGGYDALDGGLSCDAFEDFTGGISEIFNLSNPPKNMFKIMEKAVKRKSLMACSLKSGVSGADAVGLIEGHAYTVTDAKTVGIDIVGDIINVHLVRLRNPWGKGEWNGSWSDGKIEWQMLSSDQRKELEISSEIDGEFWMSYEDFISYFGRLELCTTDAQSLDEERRKGFFWETVLYDGAWTKGISAGGCRNYIDTFHTNPQYAVTLKNVDPNDPGGRCNVLISLMQKSGRSNVSGPDYKTIGFVIYELEDHQVGNVPMSNIFFRYSNQVERVTFINSRGVTARFKLKPGNYLIVPSTFHPNLETKFLLRVCYESKIDESHGLVFFKEANENLVDSKNLVEGDNFKACTSENFDSCNIMPSEPSAEEKMAEKLYTDALGSNEEMGWMDLKEILDATVPEGKLSLSTINMVLTSRITPESRGKGNYMDYKNDGFSRDICRSLIALMDTDQSSKLNLDEFKKFYAVYTKWMDAFQKFNNSEKWRLSPQELFDALKSVEPGIDMKIINLLVTRYGTTYNTILFEDYIMCAAKISSMFKLFKAKAGQDDNAKFSKDEWIAATLYS